VDYVKLWTTLLTHPKQARTSDKAWRTLTLAWMYAGEHETDGRIPPEAKPFIRLTPTIERELDELGWMHRNGHGWVLNDWADHQVDAEEVRAKRDRRRANDRDRQARHRARQKGPDDA
jgi:hypothetical protein